jgi:hypothetical protein
LCDDCILASPRIAQADPGRRTPPRGHSVTVSNQSKLEATHRSTEKSQLHFVGEDRLAHIRTIVVLKVAS